MAKSEVAEKPFAGFQRATIEDYSKNRLIGISFGEVGTRKTSFWLEAPGPIVIFSLDQGLEGVVDRVLRQAKKEIYVWERSWLPTKATAQNEAQDLRDEFEEAYYEVLARGKARTIQVDKETQFWDMYRYAEFGAANADQQKDYAALNQRYRRLINTAKATNVNLGLIAGMKDQWERRFNESSGKMGAAPSGNRIRAGYRELDELVHIVLHHYGVGPKDWAIDVGKVRGPGGYDIAGQRFSFDDVPDFSTFAQLVFPDSTPEDWK